MLAALVLAAPSEAARFVGLGDSYSSGTGTASSYSDNCQRTNAAYPILLQPQLGATGPNLSCSGARTHHITTNAQTPGNAAPQVDLPGLGADTEYVTLQIGGNDAGFVDVLTACANPFGDCSDAIASARQTAQTELPQKLLANLVAVRAKAPNAEITTVGYPRIFRPNQTCNVVFSASEVNALNAAADELDEVIRGVAHAQGVAFADPRPLFIGHGACDSAEWINGVSATFENSYHPKAVGHSGGFAPATLATIQQIPETTITGAPANPSNNAGPSFQFTSSVAGSSFQCKLDGGAYAACTSPRQYSGLGEGAHTLLVRAVNPAGDMDQFPAVHTWTIDTTPPPLTLDPGGPSGTVADDEASFAFSSPDPQAEFECRLDAGDFEPCTSPRGYSGLADGPRQFTVRAVDPAGNATSASRSWTVDTTAPVATINLGPSNPTTSDEARFEFSADDPEAELECSLDGEPFTPCESPLELSGLDEDTHGFAVRATDPVGNVGAPDTYGWTIDTTAATVSIVSGPPALTNQASVSFAFDVDDPNATVECQLDSQTPTPCDAPDAHSYAGLADGEHTFTVTATDQAENVAGDSRTFTVDTVAPPAAIDSGPSPLTSETDAEIAFSSPEATASFECRFDSDPAGFEPCSSPWAAAGLPDGAHGLEVRAVDPAGNAGTPATRSWTVDTTAPSASITTAPPALTSSSQASFAFSSSEPGSSFECRLDSTEPTDFEPCASPRAYESLADGPHSFEVRATDAAGNQQETPTQHGWSIDKAPPVVTIDGHPEDPSTTGSASFTFSADKPGSSFECRLSRIEDGAPPPFSTCSNPNYPTLADGSWVFEVRATDPLGNVGEPAVFAWLIDRVTPTVAIDSGPLGPTGSAEAEFHFSANDDEVVFECRLDSDAAQDWELCASPASYGELDEGPHRFEVRVSDAAENFSIATREWTVDTVAPVVSIDPASGPTGTVKTSFASFSFTATGGNPPSCRLDEESPAPCGASPWSRSGLPEGPRTFTVTSTDDAGNTGSATRSWTVDTVRPDTAIVAGPPASTDAISASFAFASNEGGTSFQCSLDGALFGDCASPAAYTGLTLGEHEFRVRAVDAAGNADPTPASHAWRIVSPSEGQVRGKVGGKKAKCKKQRKAGKRAKKKCKKKKKQRKRR